MAVTATSNIAPLPQLSPVQAKQLFSAPPPAQTTEPASKLAAYASPVYQFDNIANIPIEIIRDPSTGAVTDQIPPESIVRKYRLGQLRSSAPTEPSSQPAAVSPAPAAATKTTATASISIKV